jgi:hypothetical protein
MKYLIVYKLKLESGTIIIDTKECYNTGELRQCLDAMEKLSHKYTPISITPIPN